MTNETQYRKEDGTEVPVIPLRNVVSRLEEEMGKECNLLQTPHQYLSKKGTLVVLGRSSTECLHDISEKYTDSIKFIARDVKGYFVANRTLYPDYHELRRDSAIFFFPDCRIQNEEKLEAAEFGYRSVDGKVVLDYYNLMHLSSIFEILCKENSSIRDWVAAEILRKKLGEENDKQK